MASTPQGGSTSASKVPSNANANANVNANAPPAFRQPPSSSLANGLASATPTPTPAPTLLSALAKDDDFSDFVSALSAPAPAPAPAKATAPLAQATTTTVSPPFPAPSGDGVGLSQPSKEVSSTYDRKASNSSNLLGSGVAEPESDFADFQTASFGESASSRRAEGASSKASATAASSGPPPPPPPPSSVAAAGAAANDRYSNLRSIFEEEVAEPAPEAPPFTSPFPSDAGLHRRTAGDGSSSPAEGTEDDFGDFIESKVSRDVPPKLQAPASRRAKLDMKQLGQQLTSYSSKFDSCGTATSEESTAAKPSDDLSSIIMSAFTTTSQRETSQEGGPCVEKIDSVPAWDEGAPSALHPFTPDQPPAVTSIRPPEVNSIFMPQPSLGQGGGGGGFAPWLQDRPPTPPPDVGGEEEEELEGVDQGVSSLTAIDDDEEEVDVTAIKSILGKTKEASPGARRSVARTEEPSTSSTTASAAAVSESANIPSPILPTTLVTSPEQPDEGSGSDNRKSSDASGQSLHLSDIGQGGGGGGKVEEADRYTSLFELSASSFSAAANASDSPFHEWKRGLDRIQSVLATGAETLRDSEERGAAGEVWESSEGRDYLMGLREVYAVYLRISSSFEKLEPRRDVSDRLSAVETTWRGRLLLPSAKKPFESLLLPLPTSDAPSPSPLPFSSSPSPSGVEAEEEKCGVCLATMDLTGGSGGGVNDGRLVDGGVSYHSACANFWVNLVDASLPKLTRVCANQMIQN